MRFALLTAALVVAVALPARPAGEQQAAKAAYDAEMVREGKMCPHASTTIEINECLAKEANQTSMNFIVFYSNLRSLLKSNPDNEKLLDETQTAWTAYRDKTCAAIDEFWSGGTIRVSQSESCQILLTHSRMRDLNSLYDMLLHH
jgi:uncharacterized protein YecT (DUF1311 family)